MYTYVPDELIYRRIPSNKKATRWKPKKELSKISLYMSLISEKQDETTYYLTLLNL